jgi:chromosome segregation ATPase
MESQQQNMTSEVQASRIIQRLKLDIENKEMEIMRVNSDIDWANDRISKLEGALNQATTELKIRSELVEKSENKLGEFQQKVEDLERIRKTLTTQVHLLQSQLDPKEKELGKIKEKMQELTREYDISLHAITEKESGLAHKTVNLNALQKQVSCSFVLFCATVDIVFLVAFAGFSLSLLFLYSLFSLLPCSLAIIGKRTANSIRAKRISITKSCHVF